MGGRITGHPGLPCPARTSAARSASSPKVCNNLCMFTKAIPATRWWQWECAFQGFGGSLAWEQQEQTNDQWPLARTRTRLFFFFWVVDVGGGGAGGGGGWMGFWHTAEHRQTLITYRKPGDCRLPATGHGYKPTGHFVSCAALQQPSHVNICPCIPVSLWCCILNPVSKHPGGWRNRSWPWCVYWSMD